MKKVFLILFAFVFGSFVFSQSAVSFDEMTDAQVKEFFQEHRRLYELKKADFDRLSVELKNTVKFEKQLKDISRLLEDYIYSISREEFENAVAMKPSVEAIDFAPFDDQLEKWLKQIDDIRPVFDRVSEYYNKIERTLNENRKIISDYDYKVFIGNIEYKNAPRTFEQYQNALKNKAYEETERLIPVISEIDLEPMEKNVLAKIAEMKAYQEEARDLRENLPARAKQMLNQLAVYQKELPEPGQFSPIYAQFVSIKKACETVTDLERADLNKLRGIKSELDAVNFEFLENSLKAYNKGLEATKLLGMRISKDNGWSNQKQQRYYIICDKGSVSEELKLNGPLYFSTQKKNTKNDPAPDFTDMSYTDFLVNLGNCSGKSFTFIFNKKKDKPVTIQVPEIN